MRRRQRRQSTTSQANTGISNKDKKEEVKPVPVLIMSYKTLSAEAIRDGVNKNMKKEKSRSMKKTTDIPDEVSALFDYLLPMISMRYFSGTNKMMGGQGTDAQKQLDAYRKHFPPGTVGFTVPPSDKSKPPNPHYQVIEGRRIYIVRWELNYEGENLQCFHCNNGDLISQQYDYCHGYLTPIFDLDGTTSYAASMTYKCNNGYCGQTCKAADGRVFHQLPFHIWKGYPVDLKHAVKQEVHLSLSATRVMEKLMVTHGNGEQISRMMHELRGAAYEDFEEEFYTQAIQTNLPVTEQLIGKDVWRGKSGLTGTQTRDLYLDGTDSKLNSTGISDTMRNNCEIQGTGSKISTAEDDTFAALKNYSKSVSSS